MNASSIAVLAVVIAFAALALIRNIKKGTPCECGGSCSSCGGRCKSCGDKCRCGKKTQD